MYRRIVSIFILAALLYGFYACAEPAEQTGASTSAAAETAEETDYLDMFDSRDFEGAEFHIIAQSVPGEQPTVPGTEITGEIVLDALYERDRTIQEMYNVSLVYTHEKYNIVAARAQLHTDLTAAILADDCQWQFVITSLADSINRLATDGYVQDLLSVPSLGLDGPWWSQYLYENMQYNGKLLCQTGPLSLAYYYSPCALAYNRTAAENYGIGDLYTVAADGKWTFDRFAEIVKDRSEDLDGDGKITTEDFYAVISDELSAVAFFIGVGGKHDEMREGVPTFVVGEESNVSRIEKVATIIGSRDITLNTEALTGFDSFAVKKTHQFKTGKALFLAYNMNGIISQLRDMEDDYGLLPNPKWDEAQTEYYTYGSGFGPVGVAIPITTGDTEAAGVIMESMAYISYTGVGDLMLNITLREKIARDENSKLMLDIIYKDIIYDWTGLFSIGNVHILVRDICIGKKQNFASEWAKLKDNAEIKLKDILDAYDSQEIKS
ncbi:MAG: hypothetical protein PHZ09_02880 [Eubacteriales bacterium]|jgi:hypothetical protein|nr:hypothetical protein [Eubacteriales bacterium]